MSRMNKLLCATVAVVASSRANAAFDANTPGVTADQATRNVVASMVGGITMLEGLIYLLGVACFVRFILLVRRHYAKDMQGGGRSMDKNDPWYVFQIILVLALSAICFSAPTLLGSASVSILGSAPRQGIQAPSQDPLGFR